MRSEDECCAEVRRVSGSITAYSRAFSAERVVARLLEVLAGI
jgi:hypothetical protein